MAELTAHDFVATVTSRDEHTTRYEVSGSVTCPTTGYNIKLAPTNEGPIPTPESAVLAMTVITPTSQETEVITEVPVSYAGRDGAELQTIGLRLGEVRTPEGKNGIALVLDGA